MKISKMISKSDLNLTTFEYSTYISLLLHYEELSQLEIKCDHRSIGYYAKTKDNRTLREALNGLYEKEVIYSRFSEFPRHGPIEIKLNEEYFNAVSYIDIDFEVIDKLLEYSPLTLKLHVYIESFKHESEMIRGKFYMIEEIAERFSVAEKTIRNHLDNLRKEQLIDETFNAKRNRFVLLGETKEKDIRDKNIKPSKAKIGLDNVESEMALENYLVRNIEAIETGMQFINNQVKVRDGFIDIMAKDKNGRVCLIELKIDSNSKDLIFQCAYYPTQFLVPVRMITICPSYDYKINKALDTLGYVEKKVYKVKKGNIFIENKK